MRLNKYIAACGVCSRREADKLIAGGRVRVNGQTGISGMQVSEEDLVEVDEKAVRPALSKTVLAYHKPVGVTCTEKDKHAEKTIVEVLDYPVRLTYAGRLDKESEGLIIMTNDGELIQAMMKAANHHEKEYIVTVDREITDSFLEDMAKGVYLEELDETTRPCSLEKIGKYTFKIILTQGLNRQIRRMCAQLGYGVRRLVRVRIMNIGLGALKAGEYREIKGEELFCLYRLCKMEQAVETVKGAGYKNGSRE